MDFDYDEGDEFGGRILWYRVGLAVFLALLIFLLGRCTASGSDVSEEDFQTAVTERASAEEALSDRNSTIAALQQELQNVRNDAAGGDGGTVQADGATPGPTGSEAPAAPIDAPTDPDGNRIYEVQEGDTLSTIAENVYNDPRAFGIIAQANNLSGSSPLQVGQRLIIPPNPDAQ